MMHSALYLIDVGLNSTFGKTGNGFLMVVRVYYTDMDFHHYWFEDMTDIKRTLCRQYIHYYVVTSWYAGCLR